MNLQKLKMSRKGDDEAIEVAEELVELIDDHDEDDDATKGEEIYHWGHMVGGRASSRRRSIWTGTFRNVAARGRVGRWLSSSPSEGEDLHSFDDAFGGTAALTRAGREIGVLGSCGSAALPQTSTLMKNCRR